MPDPRLGERCWCVVVPRPGEPVPTLADLLDEAGIAKLKWPEHLAVMDTLPLTPTGKVQGAVLRKRLVQEALARLPGQRAMAGEGVV